MFAKMLCDFFGVCNFASRRQTCSLHSLDSKKDTLALPLDLALILWNVGPQDVCHQSLKTLVFSWAELLQDSACSITCLEVSCHQHTVCGLRFGNAEERCTLVRVLTIFNSLYLSLTSLSRTVVKFGRNQEVCTSFNKIKESQRGVTSDHYLP